MAGLRIAKVLNNLPLSSRHEVFLFPNRSTVSNAYNIEKQAYVCPLTSNEYKYPKPMMKRLIEMLAQQFVDV
jgi:hypothetical protein